MKVSTLLGVLCVALALVGTAHGFYLPGVSPKGYESNAQVPLMVNKLSSTKQQLPFPFYTLPFCAPDVRQKADLNLGQILAGDEIEGSLYELYTKYNEYCKVLCRKEYTAEEAAQFEEFIRDEYTAHLVLDNLPAAVRLYNEDDPNEVIYERGFHIGFVSDDTDHAFLYNHMRFLIKYNAVEEEENDDAVRIVGFEVEPFSVKHKYDSKTFVPERTQLRTCNDAQFVTHEMEWQDISGAGEVVFTYDVRWEESDILWSERWELYLKGASDYEVHWFAIINSLLVVLLLTGMIAMILIRALNKDIARYNDETTLEEAADETGWKLVHGDVFRPPTGTFGPIMLAVFVGSGVQIVMMALCVMLFAILGFLSPANRGGLMTALLLLYVFNGSFAGYVSARLYKSFHGKARTRTTLLTAVMYPSAIFVVGFVVNLFVWGRGSSAAIPFGTMFALLVLWLGVSTPLVFVGSFFGYRKDEMKNPVRTKEIARHVPDQPWYLNTWPAVLVGGVLPFGAVFIELFFIMSSIWQETTYYVFGFLMLALLILVVTCAEISIVMCYFQLCAENHRWWWRSFLTSGSSALYMFLYSVLYFFTKLEITDFVASLLYFGYMAMVSMTFFLLTGSIGFMACLMFTRAIYAAIKID